MPTNQRGKTFSRESSSSSSDEESASSDSDSFDDEASLSREARRMQAHDTSSSSSDEESVHDNNVNNDDVIDNDTSDEDDESASDDESSSSMLLEDERALSLPLSERLKRDAEKGVNMKQKRERQKAALQAVTDRLQKDKPSALVKPNKKKSKHAPTEASSKRPPSHRRNVFDLNESGLGISIGEHRYKPRDPRKSSLHGRINVEQFDKNYGFLKEIREKEIERLKSHIRARQMTGPKGQERRKRLGITNDGRTVEDDQAELKKLTQEKSDWERQMIAIQAEKTVKQQLKSKPYHPKRKEYKKMLNLAKFDEIRKRGGDAAISKVIAKRRKKNKSKDANLLGGVGSRPCR
jgi:ribosomal RNA-processing protein 36